MNHLGVPTEFDPNDGRSAGAAFVPTDLDPNNQTRSDARRTYFDPFASRDNFQVITGQHVTRILIDSVSGSQGSNPVTESSSNSHGPATANSDGFGFSPVGNDQPPTNHSKTRRDHNLPELKILGVEVISVGNALPLSRLTSISLHLMPLRHAKPYTPKERSLWLLVPCIRHSFFNYLALGLRHC